MLLRVICLAVFLATSGGFSSYTQRKAVATVYRWKQIDFAFPTPQHREQAIQNG